jgi:hypothetical protein
MEDLDRLDQLLKQRPFKSLSQEERNYVFQFVDSEEEYNALQNTEVELRKFGKSGADLRPRKDTWSGIRRTLSKKEENEKQFWLRPVIPAYAVALLLIAVGVAGWWSGVKFGSEKMLVEKIVTHVDTLRIVSRPDTIVREKFIYLPLQPVVTDASQSLKDESITAKGVNMKDKEELERLLVSGSY